MRGNNAFGALERNFFCLFVNKGGVKGGKNKKLGAGKRW
jgi:hypothetical protein